ncbi:hypothetical protein MMC20_004807 [Loxospora ochrophaea]|nr:hypothetical protein [Loxospora ochrophaea]
MVSTSFLPLLPLVLLASHALALPHLERLPRHGHHHHSPSGFHPTGTASAVSGYLYPTGTGSAVSGYPYPSGTGYYPYPNGTGNWTYPSTASHTVSLLTGSGSLPNRVSYPTLSSQLDSSGATLASATSSAPSATASSVSDNSTDNGFLRGVNVGGWLVLEKWMDSDAFTGDFANAVDQYTFDSISGAADALQTHWSTWFTEADVTQLASTGINALRIPIGHWAYNNSGTPYLQGADAYLEQAIGWAKAANMKVWIDCHGSPGSQNGFDNSGHAGDVDWQSGDNMAVGTEVLVTMVRKYGTPEYAGTVVGLEMTNEPISYGNNKFSTTQSWAQDAYKQVKAAATNPDLMIVMHDAFEGPSAWTDISSSIGPKGSPNPFGIDQHLYQLYTDAYNAMNQSAHIAAACGWSSELATANAISPVFVGEWSAATNICVNPDGSTTAGTSCSTAGCQCQSAPLSQWNSQMTEQVRKFVEAQLDVFEQSSSGYFMWSFGGPGGWGFMNGINNGLIPNPVTSRQYPSQC